MTLKKGLIVALTIALAACNNSFELRPDANDHFFLENQGAVMPVFVRGNTQSKVFLVYLHGGPGHTSLEAFGHEVNPFNQLQKSFAVVYWEQRCAGASQGNCNFDNLSLDQYTNDLEELIVLLKNIYSSDIKIFLVGHSWGGSLGILYLSTNQNQSNISGWIEVAGGHNVPRIVELEREMVNEVGNRQIDIGNNINDWEEIISKANSLNLSHEDDIFEMNRLSRRSEELMQNVDSVNSKINTFTLLDYFFSPLDIHAASINSTNTVIALQEEIACLNLTGRLSTITIPTLMIWGKYDFRVPPGFGVEELENYGSENKKIEILGMSAHFCQWNEPESFTELIRAFIEENR